MNLIICPDAQNPAKGRPVMDTEQDLINSIDNVESLALALEQAIASFHEDGYYNLYLCLTDDQGHIIHDIVMPDYDVMYNGDPLLELLDEDLTELLELLGEHYAYAQDEGCSDGSCSLYGYSGEDEDADGPQEDL